MYVVILVLEIYFFNVPCGFVYNVNSLGIKMIVRSIKKIIF